MRVMHCMQLFAVINLIFIKKDYKRKLLLQVNLILKQFIIIKSVHTNIASLLSPNNTFKKVFFIIFT